jgi:hypothetical protein
MRAFCGEGVEAQRVDPCALVVVANWRAPSAPQQKQHFFTHADFLPSRMHPEVAAEAVVLA